MTTTMSFRKTLLALGAAATIAVGTVAAPSEAEAGRRGGAIAAGIIGGLALGAIIASAHPYYYYGPAPVYYGPRCYWQRQRVWDGYGWSWQRVRVCY